MRVKEWIKSNRIISFMVLTFFITYLVGISFNGFIHGTLGSFGFVFDTYLARFFILFGPFLAACFVTWTTSGEKSVGELLGRLIPKGRYFIWWILPLIIGLLVTGAGYALAGYSPSDQFNLVLDHPGSFMLQFAGQLLVVSVGEEVGWRGWLLPNLLKKFSVFRSLILITVIWGLWHFPVFLSGSEILVPWLMILIAMSIILTWLWFRTRGNLFAVLVMHASVNAPQFFMSDILPQDDFDALHLAAFEIMGYVYLALAVIPLISLLRAYGKPTGNIIPADQIH